ncbi:hypothetical protein BC936DRAFT_142076 [Jimgerdemannia flammicorona]|uniref:Amidase domain-containing protein n=1 Tax=Jimgerdemannia flammicorona TaxID=994334 RepID=A0A433DFJ4_9FUNG|nr:hypothetical protein BC936DRAFT_142076 [Jimgerdemannia flammicorona]
MGSTTPYENTLVLPASGYSTVPAAIAGCPIITVPLGYFSTGESCIHRNCLEQTSYRGLLLNVPFFEYGGFVQFHT